MFVILSIRFLCTASTVNYISEEPQTEKTNILSESIIEIDCYQPLLNLHRPLHYTETWI